MGICREEYNATYFISIDLAGVDRNNNLTLTLVQIAPVSNMASGGLMRHHPRTPTLHMYVACQGSFHKGLAPLILTQ